MQTNKYLVVIVGPTAVGKTALSIELAKKLQTEIISADSRQFYHEMAIGTAQPTREEMQGIPHHFLSFLSVEETYTAGTFAREALKKLDTLFETKDIVVLIGGSGLYIQALCEGLATFPPIDPTLRTLLNHTLQTEGLITLTNILDKQDPVYYNEVDLKNPKRVIRALEVCLATGLPYSSLRETGKQKKTFETIKIGLYQEKKLLHERIDHRVDLMMEHGLLKEAEKLYAYKAYNALQTIGYKELFGYMDRNMTLQEAITQIKVHTKQYAKKQMTWFQKDNTITWFSPDAWDSIEKHIQQQVMQQN